MEANAATKVSQSWLCRSKALPATTPNVSSIERDGHAQLDRDHAGEQGDSDEYCGKLDGVQPDLPFVVETLGRGHQPRRAVRREPHRVPLRIVRERRCPPSPPEVLGRWGLVGCSAVRYGPQSSEPISLVVVEAGVDGAVVVVGASRRGTTESFEKAGEAVGFAGREFDEQG